MRATSVVAVLWLLSAPSAAEEPTPPSTSYFNERWLDAVVSVESAGKAAGTAFLVKGCPKDTILVTAAHVVRDESGALRPDLTYRRSDLAKPQPAISDAALQSADLGLWAFSRSADLAARRFGWLESAGSPPVIPTEAFIDPKIIDVGAPLLVLGFPLGLQSAEHNQPIARHGIVAGHTPAGLLVEAFVFPGNSGGPVVYVPHIKVGGAIRAPHLSEERLIGVVSSYLPYSEAAISVHTKRPRVVFEENSGLANVVPISELAVVLRDSAMCRD